MGLVESKDDSNVRGETPSKKLKKSSHMSPFKKKAGQTAAFQTELESMDDKSSERFAQLEAMFLARRFSVPVEPFQ